MEQIKTLIPHVCENFITFPLWEEGDYCPVVNVWKIYFHRPKQIKDGQVIDLLKLDPVKFKDKDFFDVIPSIIYRKKNTFYFLGEKICAKSYYHVKFEISVSTKYKFDEEMYLVELLHLANWVIGNIK